MPRLSVPAAACLTLALGLSGAFPAKPRAQGPPGSAQPPVVFHVATSIDPLTVQLHYALLGGRGFFDSFVHTQRDVRDYAIETTANGLPATRLRAYAHAPGFGYWTADIDLSTGPSSRVIDLTFQSLGTIRLTGRVVLPDSTPTAGRTLAIRYSADWSCEFYGLVFGRANAIEPLVSTTLQADGAFTVDVPDLARDPALATLRSKGTLHPIVLAARGNPSIDLGVAPTDAGDRHTMSPAMARPFTIASSNPADLRLVPMASVPRTR